MKKRLIIVTVLMFIINSIFAQERYLPLTSLSKPCSYMLCNFSSAFFNKDRTALIFNSVFFSLPVIK